MSNTFGKIFRLTTFGESHGEAIGGVVDGMPAGIPIDVAFIQQELNRRRPGQSSITTSRNESDRVELLSGIFEGKSTGAPIGFVVYNQNQHSADYDNMRDLFRPSHADYTYHYKYGVRDHRGGGRSSARITISRCVAGALAKLALRQLGIRICAYTSQVGNIALEGNYTQYDLNQIESNIVRCPDAAKAEQMIRLIEEVKADGDNIGGVITGVIQGCPPGLGSPEFGKLHAQLGAAMLSMALPNVACSLLASGSPSPAGQPLMTQVMMPPMVSPSAFTSWMRRIMASAFSGSGQRTALVSMSDRS